MAATMLLRNMPELSNPQARRIWDEVRGLLHVAVAQQAESSASRHQGLASKRHVEPAHHEREVSIHQEVSPRGKKAAPIRERIIDNHEPHDASHNINEHGRWKHGDTEERGYNAYRGGRYC